MDQATLMDKIKTGTTLCKAIMRNGYDAYAINAPLQGLIFEKTGVFDVDIACACDTETLFKIFPNAVPYTEEGAMAMLQENGVTLRFYSTDVEDASHPEMSQLRITPRLARLLAELQLKGQLKSSNTNDPEAKEFEDFDKTIDGTPGLVYVQTGTENLYTIRVVHKPTGSTGEFFTEFPVRCNTTRHAGVKATFVYDASLVESYNAEHKTSYAALPAEYLTLENTTLTVPENATASADSVKVTLTGNLSLLTERNYLAPLRIKAESIDASEVMGAVYVAVATEINLIRAIESTDDMVG